MKKHSVLWFNVSFILTFALLCLSLSQRAQATCCLFPPNGLVSWWPGDGNANDVADSNNGTFNGPYVAGKVRSAFGITDPTFFVTVPNNTNLNLQQLTVDAWVKATCTPADEQYIVVKGNDVGCAGGASYALYTDLTIPGTIAFYISDGVNVFKVSDPAFVWDNNWHFIAGTYDGSNLKLYVDGNLVATTPAPGVIIGYAFPDNNFYIGNYPGCNVPPGTSSFCGSIDEVEVFSRALTAAEVQSIFNAGSSGKCRPLTTF